MKNIIVSAALLLTAIFPLSAAQSHVIECEIVDGGQSLSSKV